jgi:Tfp pilus assembly protein PilF
MAERFPESPVAWSALANLAATAGETETAERAFRSWLELAPGDSSAYANYGFFLFRTGHAAEARAVLEKAAGDFPGSGPVWMNLGVVLEELGERQAAAEAQRKAQALMTEEERASLLR